MCGVGVGWGGIITNVVVVLKTSVKRRGCFHGSSSTPHARLVLGYNEFSKVVRRYDKEEENEVIAGTQLLDRTWQELNKCPEEPHHLTAKKKKHGLLEIWEWSDNFQKRFNAGTDLWKENVQKFSTAQAGKMPENTCERRKNNLRIPPCR